MVYDCFCFFNELDLLEIRLNTLDKVVDRFILVESLLTHSGHPKPLYYANNKHRFSKFNHRIIHIIVNDFPEAQNITYNKMAWIRENWQRNAIFRGIPKTAKDEDYIIISDLDEIPSPEAIKIALSHNKVTRLNLKMFYYFLNYKNFTYPTWNLGPQVLPLHIVRYTSTLPKLPETDFIIKELNKAITPTVIRFMQSELVIKNAGWHFSYCGGIKAIQAKIKAIAHTENDTEEILNPNNIQKRIYSGKLHFNRNDKFYAIHINDSFPQYIRDNLQKFNHLIFPLTLKYKIKKFIPKSITFLKQSILDIIRRTLPRKLKDFLYHVFISK